MPSVKILAIVALLWLMFVEGVGIDRGALAAALRRPLYLLRAFVVVDVLVPLVAWILIVWTRPALPVAATLVLVASCPIAPLALRRTSRATRQRETAGAIHLVLGILSIVSTPLTLSLLGRAIDADAEVSALAIARNVLLVLVLPLLAGVAFGAMRPDAAKQVSRAGGRIALLILALILVLVLYVEGGALARVGTGSYATLAAFVAGALLVGHLFGIGEPEERELLAMEAASRNLGLAFFVASTVVGKRAALPFLAPYVVVFLFVTSIYLLVLRSRGRGTRAG